MQAPNFRTCGGRAGVGWPGHAAARRRAARPPSVTAVDVDAGRVRVAARAAARPASRPGTAGLSACAGSWRISEKEMAVVGCTPPDHRTAGAGRAKGRAVSQTGTRSRAAAPPRMSPQAPGTKLTDGHEAPQHGRPPRPAAGADVGYEGRGGESPGPSTSVEATDLGRQGFAERESIPQAGAPTSIGTTPTAFATRKPVRTDHSSFPMSRGAAPWAVNQWFGEKGEGHDRHGACYRRRPR